jgi:hypothetical protein
MSRGPGPAWSVGFFVPLSRDPNSRGSGAYFPMSWDPHPFLVGVRPIPYHPDMSFVRRRSGDLGSGRGRGFCDNDFTTRISRGGGFTHPGSMGIGASVEGEHSHGQEQDLK